MGGGGSGQYLNVNFTGPNLRASHTFMARVKHQDAATNYNAIQAYYLSQSDATGSAIQRVSGGTSTAMNWLRQAGYFGYAQDTAARSTCFGNTTTWYHIAFVYNASTGQIRAYIDGTFIAQQASSTTRPTSSTANGFGIAGSNKVADAAFFDRALDDAEVASMAAYRVPQVTSGLQVFWRLDSNANDSSGNGRNGSVVGSGTAPTYSTADNPPQPETPVLDIAGTATTVSALTGSLTVSKALVSSAFATASALSGSLTVAKALASSGFTTTSSLTGTAAIRNNLAGALTTTSALTAWIRPRWGRRYAPSSYELWSGTGPAVAGPWTVAVWSRRIDAGSGIAKPAELQSGGGKLIQIAYLAGDVRVLVDSGGGGDATAVTTTAAATLGQWYHHAVTYDGATVRTYVDGAEVDARVYNFAPGAETLNSVYTESAFGTSATIEAASFKLWTAQLSAAEIQSERDYHVPHYQTGSLFAFWAMGWEAPLNDTSGNARHRTFSGGTRSDAQTESPELLGSPFTEIAGAATTTSALSGTLAVSKALSGSAATVSQLAASLALAVALQGSASTVSALSGTLTQSVALASSAHTTTSALTGTLSVQHALVGDLVTTSSLTGTLGQDVVLAGDASTVSALSGALSVAVALAGDSATVSSFSATLSQQQTLAGSMSTVSALTGALAVFDEAALAGDALTLSALDATLHVAKPIAGDAATVSSLSGALTLALELQGAASTASNLAGTVTAFAFLGADAVTTSAFAGELSVTNALAGDSLTTSALTGALTQEVGLAGDMLTASSLNGSISGELQLVGNVVTTSALSGDLYVAVPLAGDAATSSALAGALSLAVPLAANATTVSALTGTLRKQIALVGSMQTVSALSGGLRNSALAGSLLTTSQLAATLRPLWGSTIAAPEKLTRTGIVLPRNSFTIMAWMRIASGFNTQLFVTDGVGQTGFGGVDLILTRFAATTEAAWIFENIGRAVTIATSIDGWHHLALTSDGTTVELYLDQSAPISAASSPTGNVGTTTFEIYTQGTGATGEVAQVKMWSSALTAEEVLSEQQYHTPHTRNGTLEAWYQLAWFDQLADDGGNNLDLTGTVPEGTTQAPGLFATELSEHAASGDMVTGGDAKAFLTLAVPPVPRRRRWPVKLR